MRQTRSRWLGPGSLPRTVLAALLAASAPVAACSSRASSPVQATTALTVLAASSLAPVLPGLGREFERSHPGTAIRPSFAGTPTLVAQIEQGVPADVFIGASWSYGDRLFREGLIDAPRALCTNRLVVVVPASNPAGISSPRDLARPGVKVVIGAQAVPVGTYTRAALSALERRYGRGFAGRVLSNVVSEEDNVEEVVTKVRLGEADAGFVYVTDARAAGSAVRTLPLPPWAAQVAVYPVASVRASRSPGLAAEFVGFLLGPVGQSILARAGFGPPRAP